MPTKGKQYPGELAPAFRTPEEAAELQAEQAQYAKPNAMPIAAYFMARGINNPIMQASMLAHTVVRLATEEDFDVIFKDH